jgi:hypothetical protein
MDFTSNAKLTRIANGDFLIHACLHHPVETFLVDA